jgi:Tol biopolymer transport system component
MKCVTQKVVILTAAIMMTVGTLGSTTHALDGPNSQRVSEGGTSAVPIQANASSDGLSVSTDGRYVAFASDATNLVAGDTNGRTDVFIMDRKTHTVTRVSEGGTAATAVEGDGDSNAPAISADGRYIAFTSSATNLVVGDTNNRTDIFVMDRQTHTVTRVSEGGTGGLPVEGGSSSSNASISADGRYVAFDSSANNLVSGDTNGKSDVFVMDRQTHTVTRVSEGGTSASLIQGNNSSGVPSISADGRYVTFASYATNLVAGDTNLAQDIFLMDNQTHTLTRVSEGGTSAAPIQSNDYSDIPKISANGMYIVFFSTATNLVAGDTNGNNDIFVMDLATHSLTRVSEGGTSSSPIEGIGSSDFPTISADGRYVAFTSDAANLVPGDTNANQDIFIADRTNHTTRRMNLGGTSGAPTESDSYSYSATISGDGATVGYISGANNLVAGDTGFQDIFVSPGTYVPADDNDGVDQATEAAAPNSGDANNDGTPDSEQAHVTSVLSPTSGKYVALESTCTTNYNVQIGGESAGTADTGYDYPAGLIGFVLQGCTVGGTATITQYYYGTYDLSKLSLRKWQDNTYKNVPGAVFTSVTIGGQSAVRVVYQITDGSSLDDDGIADGNIVDPAGIATAVLAAATVGAPNTGLPKASNLGSIMMITVSLGILVATGNYVRKTKTASKR